MNIYVSRLFKDRLPKPISHILYKNTLENSLPGGLMCHTGFFPGNKRESISDEEIEEMERFRISWKCIFGFAS